MLFRSVSLFSEIFFTCLLLLVFLTWSRPGLGMAFLAGIAAAACYLTRTAALPLVVAIPVHAYLKRDWRRGAAFLLAMLPAVIGWALWTRANRIVTTEAALVYYTDYLGFFLLNVGWDDIVTIARQNFDQLLYGIGSLLLPRVTAFPVVAIMTRMLGIGSCFAVFRLARRGVAVPYAFYSLAYGAILRSEEHTSELQSH